MKRLIKITAVFLVLTMAGSLIACSCGTEETRYTVTEEEWDAAQEQNSNVTAKHEYYMGEDESTIQVVKYADGYSCSCDGEKWWENEENIPSIQSSRKESATSTPTADSVSGSSRISRTRSVDNTVAASAEDSMMGELVMPDISVNDMSETVTIYPAFSGIQFYASGNQSFIFDTIIGDYEIGDHEFILEFGYSGKYQDGQGNEYIHSAFNYSTASYGACTMEYKGDFYVELPVLDKNGKTVVKWTKQQDITIERSAKIPFDEVVYDEAERAYVYETSEKFGEYEYNLKTYFYFENGKLLKVISFNAQSTEGGKAADLSKVTPKDLISDKYVTFVSRYYNHGETEIKHHSFSKDDIITKVKK